MRKLWTALDSSIPSNSTRTRPKTYSSRKIVVDICNAVNKGWQWCIACKEISKTEQLLQTCSTPIIAGADLIYSDQSVVSLGLELGLNQWRLILVRASLTSMICLSYCSHSARHFRFLAFLEWLVNPSPQFAGLTDSVRELNICHSRVVATSHGL